MPPFDLNAYRPCRSSVREYQRSGSPLVTDRVYEKSIYSRPVRQLFTTPAKVISTTQYSTQSQNDELTGHFIPNYSYLFETNLKRTMVDDTYYTAQTITDRFFAMKRQEYNKMRRALRRVRTNIAKIRAHKK